MFTCVASGGVLVDAELFDSDFFDVRPRDVELPGPQQTFFLKSRWETRKIARYDRDGCSESLDHNPYELDSRSRKEVSDELR